MILKDKQVKRQLWKVCKVKDVITGAHGKVRAAKEEVPSPKANKLFQRPLQHLIPIEVRCDIDSEHSAGDKADFQSSCSANDRDASPSLHNRT